MTPAAHEHEHKALAHQRWVRNLAIGSALAVGAVIVAPYVLPLVGVGDAALAEDMALAVHGTGLGNGIAGAVNHMLNAVPFIGGELAKGGAMAAAATGVIGIGGVLLGRYVERRDDGTKHIRWGKIITAAALVASSLIALPSLLTGISSGIAFLSAAAISPEIGSAVAGWLSKTIGAIGTASMAAAGLSGTAFTLPHLLTCGTSVAPAAIAFVVSGRKPATAANAQIVARIAPGAPTEANVPCEATVTLHDAKTGKPITPDQLAVKYAHKLHLLIIDQSLGDYQHVHPEPTGNPGEYRFHFTPRTGNSYTAWVDLTREADGQSFQIKAPVAAKKSRRARPITALNSQAELNGLRFDWHGDPLRQGEDRIVEVTVSDAGGRPVENLEPVMGAFAHLVGFTADGNAMVHCHPLDGDPVSPQDRGGPRLRFHVHPPSPGPMRFYLQVKQGGEELFVPFGQQIARNQSFAAQPGISPLLRPAHGLSH